MEDFIPINEEERQFYEAYSGLSISSSKMIRSLPQEQRLPALKEVNPSDTSLLALYIWAMKNEDYETCAVAKALIGERGIPITKWPSP